MSDNALITEHNLDFEVAPWHNGPMFDDWSLFRIGTVHGQWRYAAGQYEILSILNDKPGNNHLTDFFQWFEFACKRDGYNLLIREVMNERFKKHLIEKRGFTEYGADDAIKHFKNDH